jgi:hypothetical protein
MLGLLGQFLPAERNLAGRAVTLLKAAEANASPGWFIGPSDIAGNGVFAAKDYLAGDRLGQALIFAGKDSGDNDQWTLTVFGQHCNHQRQCNALLVAEQGRQSFWLIAKEPITADTEITVDYEQVTRQIGFSAEMLWEGKPVPAADLAEYVERSKE